MSDNETCEQLKKRCKLLVDARIHLLQLVTQLEQVITKLDEKVAQQKSQIDGLLLAEDRMSSTEPSRKRKRN